MMDLAWYDILIYYIGIGAFIAWFAETVVRWNMRSKKLEYTELHVVGFLAISLAWIVMVPISFFIYFKRKYEGDS